MTISPDTILAWKIQINEHLKALSARPTNRPAEYNTITSKVDDTIYKIRKVAGDGDCFFNSINDPKITRKKLISELLNRANESEIRKCFALEIRQFLFLGLVDSHQGQQEQQAYEKFQTTKFQELNQQLVKHESKLRTNLQTVIESHPEAEGKTPEQLLELFKGNNEDAVVELKKTCKKVNQLGQNILTYCSEEELFKNYVKFYLRDARGFVPFSRHLIGENVKTPIDAINFIFSANIQVFLNDGERLVAGSGTPPIPILHNGRDHFDGLAPQAREGFLTFSRIIDQMPSCEKPSVYPMEHLLQAGFMGSHYQFLVLLHKVTELMSLGRPFEAMFEAKGYGNADDVVIRSKDKNGQTTIRGFQAKCYKDLIKINHFFNKESNQKQQKNVKMHIGKFFQGWMALQNNNCQYREIIVYTNTDVDTTLKKCIDNNRFSTSFIEQRKKVDVTVNKQKQDLFDVLYKQSKSYCEKEISKKTFQEFLGLFRFSLNQKDIQPLSDSIIDNLKNIKKDWKGRFDQLFIDLYYATTKWFMHNHRGQRLTPRLTNEVLTQFIDQSWVRSEVTIKLQTITELTLKQIGNTAMDKISRKETKYLEKALEAKGLIVVSGDKGIGKSFLIKEFLSDYEPDRYLFLSTKEVVNDKRLQNEVFDVLKHSSRIFVCVLDAAEALLSLPPLERNKLITSLIETKHRIILTLPTADLPTLNIDTGHSDVILESLNPKDVSKNHPNLQNYIQQNPRLFCIPFYLNIMLQLLERSSSKAPDDFKSLFDKDLKMKLIKEAIAGANPELKKKRVTEWKKLASSLARGAKGSKLTSVDPSLEEDGIVLDKQFTHDLFFEYGLMNFWTTKKGVTTAPTDFWKDLPNYLKFDNPIPVLAEWIKNQSLQKEIVDSAAELSPLEVFEKLIATAIVMKDREFLVKLLRQCNDFSHIHNNILFAITIDDSNALKALLDASISNLTNSKSSDELSEHSKMSTSESESDVSDDEPDGSYMRGSDMDTSSENSFSNDEDSGLPMFLAIELNRMKCLKLLIKDGTYLDELDSCKKSALHFAAFQGSSQAIQELVGPLEQEINSLDTSGDTPLHNAVYNQHIEVVELLLEKGADPNILNSNGLSPLHIAMVHLNVELVKLLLISGGDLSIAPLKFDEKINISNLLRELPNDLQGAMEKFVIDLINYLFLHKDCKGWSTDVIDKLKTLVKHRAKVSENYDRFDYQDSDSEICHVLMMKPDKIDDLEDKILDDPERINEVISSYYFENPDIREEHIKSWIDNADDSEYDNIRDYAVEHSDDEVQYCLIEHAINCDETKLDGLHGSLTGMVLADITLIHDVLSSNTFKDRKIELVEQWLARCDDSEYNKIKEYADYFSDDEVKDCLDESEMSSSSD